MKTRTVFLYIVVILASLIVGCAPTGQPATGTETQTETIKFGVMLPLTGDGAAYGTPIQDATMIAIEEINAKGGINGKRIEVVTEDSKCNPKDGATAAQKLVNVDKVKFIIGGACSGETLGAAPITESAGVILISPSATNPAISQSGDYVFRTAPSDANAGKVAANVAYTSLGKRNAALFSETTDYAQGLKNVFKDSFSSLGGKIVADETFASEDTDMRTQVLKAKSVRPDVIYVVAQTPAKAELLLKQLKEEGVKEQIVASEVLLGRDFVKEHHELFEGGIGVEPRLDEEADVTKTLLGKYKQKTGKDAPWPQYMSGARDAVYLLAEGIGKHGEDPAKVRDFLYTVKDWSGALGKITLDSNGDSLMPYSVKKVQGEHLVEIEVAQ